MLVSAVIELFQEISAPVKVGWMLWIIWCVAQIVWYRRARVMPVQAPAPRLDTSPPQTAEPRLEVPVAPLEGPSQRPVVVAVAAVTSGPDSKPKPSRRRHRSAIDASEAIVGPV